MKIDRATLAASAIGLVLLLFLHTSGRLLNFSLAWPWLPVFLAAGLLAWRGRRVPLAGEVERGATPEAAGANALVLFTLLAVCSSLTVHKWFFFVQWDPASVAGGRWPGVYLAAALALLALPYAWSQSGRSAWPLFAALVVLQVLAIHAFHTTTAGRVLYNDDHPSFLYRLWVFGQTFPRLMNYSPLWNAGFLDTAGLETGVAAPGLLTFPLWKWGSILEHYNTGLLIVFVVVIPLLAAASLRIMGGGWVAAWVAAMLALGVSRYHFLWLLNYGTLGAGGAAAAVMPVAACLYRVMILDRRSPSILLVLTAGVLFLLFWPMGVFMLLPLALPVLWNWRAWSLRKMAWLAAAGLIVVLAFLYPLLVITHHTDATARNWVEPAKMALPLGQAAAEGWAYLLNHVREVHPVLIFLGGGGAMWWAGPAGARWFAPVLIGFALYVGWGKYVIPDLPLYRLSIPMFFAAVPPAALLAEQVLAQPARRHLAARAVLLALLLAGGWNVARLYGNAKPAMYSVMPPDILRLAEWAKTATPPDARIWIAGRTGHNYGGGHVPFLPVLLEREMVSSEYRHDQIPAIEEGSPPADPPGSPAELDRYIEDFAVYAAITLDQRWRDYLSNRPDRFEALGKMAGTGLHAFRVRHPTTLFQTGSGSAKAGLNRLAVRVDDPTNRVVIRYLWRDGLTAEPPASVSPVDLGDGVRLIGIAPNGAREIVVRFARWY